MLAVNVASRGAVGVQVPPPSQYVEPRRRRIRELDDQRPRPHLVQAGTRTTVTIPKLPPPPRSPQNSSGFSSALARTTSPSAVTTSYDTTLSQASPNRRASQPIPPPSVSPPTPVCETFPAVVASPCSCAALSSSPSSRAALDPGPLAAGSTRTVVHRRQVDHQPALGHGETGDVVPAAANRDLQLRGPAEPDRRGDVGGGRAPGDHGRATVDHRVPDGACLVVPGVAAAQEGLGHVSSFEVLVLSTTLTAERYVDKVQFYEPNRGPVPVPVSCWSSCSGTAACRCTSSWRAGSGTGSGQGLLRADDRDAVDARARDRTSGCPAAWSSRRTSSSSRRGI